MMRRVKGAAHGALLVLAAWLALATPAAAVAPTASFSVSPASPHTLETVTFTSTSTGDVASQSWDLDGQGGCNDATGPSAERSFPTAGSYRIALCVFGPDGDAAQAQNVIVSNREPLASFAHLPATPEAGEMVSFVSTSEDPDGAITRQAWDLDGDGRFNDGTEASASRAFRRPGTYSVSLRVVDSHGARVVSTQAVAVRAKLLAPFPTVGIRGVLASGAVWIESFEVDAPPGARVRIRCRGPGCPSPRRTTASRVRRFRRFERRFEAGAVLEIFVTKPGTIGKYTRVKVRRDRPPARQDLCLFPRRKRPRACPSVA